MPNMDKKKYDDSNFRKLLAEEITWPHVYMFKFIVPANQEKEAQVLQFFPKGAEISYKKSRTGKYISITIRTLTQSPNEVLQYYENVAKIEGVMSL